MATPDIDWYFDFISPYAYFGWQKLATLPAETCIVPRPVLFAGLLSHWGQKGPAEVSPKRQWTYRWCQWSAAQQGIDFRMPASHPFNPLPYLRLAVAADCDAGVIDTIFRQLWTTGVDAQQPATVEALAQRVGLDPAACTAKPVKDALRAHTDRAIARGVFGVPTLAIDAELFWGADATAMAAAYLADPALFQSEEMRRVSALPVGRARSY